MNPLIQSWSFHLPNDVLAAIMYPLLGIRSAEAVPVFDRQRPPILAPSQVQRGDCTAETVVNRAKQIVS